MQQSVENLVVFAGKKTLSFLNIVKEISKLINEVFYWTFISPMIGGKIRFKSIFSEMVKVGYNSILIVSVISFFVGIILALQSAYQLKKVGALIYIANLVGVSLTRELGPIITAIIVAGRSGSSFAAEIGSMKAAEEIDALKSMGINPVSYLVSPKMIAMLIMVPCLTILSDFIGILGGFVLAITAVNIHPFSYIQQTLNALMVKDVITGLVKAISFGGIITIVGTYHGFQVSGGAEEVGRRTTSSVVSSIFMVIVFDLFFTALFYYFT
ncbi:MAG TPA: ABC transporter permease [Nitrospirae bacterium]|nr:ABC transporter permease [Nitrospirota bacterium]